MPLLKHFKPSAGYTPIFTPGEGELKHIRFGMLCLSAGQRHIFAPEPGHEAALTILTGSVKATASDQTWGSLGGRTNVFDSATDTLFVPDGNRVELEALGSESEIAVSQATSDFKGPVTLYPAADAVIAQRGLPGWQREVRTYITPAANVNRLILGETINGVGQWSSFPSHKHDRNNLPIEADLEEVYLFKIEPPTGFAFQGLYSPDDPETANRAFLVRKDDVVAIPRGYHPVAAAPGHRVYYFWILAGNGHDLKFYTQDELRWLEPGL
jgi:5-deoxy-glucuronate isomerase